ncbi:hypothetical protein PENTCL1PPCAC_15305 [Pristionchus entomophagus]|uniref:Uncharacterized protein n=1 Tax=Pristionchus entomophagus TaxID=358040 RepID=A0AAV5TD75_9BILA|nr:hypothetical protein PENTCL1PPCAC_15305 [Pristionchus entomophagus]
MLLIVGLALMLVVCGEGTEMQRQCLCTESEACVAKVPDAIETCADSCKQHVTKLGASYPEAYKCVNAHRSKFEAALECGHQHFKDACTNSTTPKMVPRIYPETMQLAVVHEVTSLLKKSGILSQATKLLMAGRKAAGCMIACGKKTDCWKLQCSLDFPSNNEVVAVSKACAIKAGYTTPVAKEICNCLADVGIDQLKPLCSKITIE